jgi:hypothetical protein
MDLLVLPGASNLVEAVTPSDLHPLQRRVVMAMIRRDRAQRFADEDLESDERRSRTAIAKNVTRYTAMKPTVARIGPRSAITRTRTSVAAIPSASSTRRSSGTGRVRAAVTNAAAAAMRK